MDLHLKCQVADQQRLQMSSLLTTKVIAVLICLTALSVPSVATANAPHVGNDIEIFTPQLASVTDLAAANAIDRTLDGWFQLSNDDSVSLSTVMALKVLRKHESERTTAEMAILDQWVGLVVRTVGEDFTDETAEYFGEEYAVANLSQKAAMRWRYMRSGAAYSALFTFASSMAKHIGLTPLLSNPVVISTRAFHLAEYLFANNQSETREGEGQEPLIGSYAGEDTIMLAADLESFDDDTLEAAEWLFNGQYLALREVMQYQAAEETAPAGEVGEIADRIASHVGNKLDVTLPRF